MKKMSASVGEHKSRSLLARRHDDVAFSLSRNEELYRDMYRQARDAIRKLADPSDAPIACFTIKHIFKEARDLDWANMPDAHLQALQSLEALLQSVKEKFCGDADDERGAEIHEALNKVLDDLERLIKPLVGKRDARDLALYLQPSEDLLDCQTCGGEVLRGPNPQAPWTGVKCSLDPHNGDYQKCRSKQQARREGLKRCGAKPHGFDNGYSISDPDLREKRACVKKFLRE